MSWILISSDEDPAVRHVTQSVRDSGLRDFLTGDGTCLVYVAHGDPQDGTPTELEKRAEFRKSLSGAQSVIGLSCLSHAYLARAKPPCFLGFTTRVMLPEGNGPTKVLEVWQNLFAEMAKEVMNSRHVDSRVRDGIQAAYDRALERLESVDESCANILSRMALMAQIDALDGHCNLETPA